VPKVSAVVLGAIDSKLIAIHADYINIVKFRLKLDYRYKIVSGYIRVMSRNAGDAISRQ
jgi:hypothetical protein